MNIEYLEALVIYLGAIILIATPFVFLLEKAAQRWLAHALTTPSPHDDRAASAAVRACAAFLACVAFLPRVSTGLAEARRVRDAIQAIPRPRVPPALLVLLLVLPMSLSAACGGAGIQTTRSALLITDGVVDRIDAEVAPLAEDAHERALAESTSREEYDRRMRPWVRVSSAITGVQAALLASAITVEAVEAGQAGDVLGTIGCTVEALAELAAMLPEVGVNVPPTLRTAIALLAELAGDVCPAPSEPEPDVGAEVPS